MILFRKYRNPDIEYRIRTNNVALYSQELTKNILCRYLPNSSIPIVGISLKKLCEIFGMDNENKSYLKIISSCKDLPTVEVRISRLNETLKVIPVFSSFTYECPRTEDSRITFYIHEEFHKKLEDDNVFKQMVHSMIFEQIEEGTVKEMKYSCYKVTVKTTGPLKDCTYGNLQKYLTVENGEIYVVGQNSSCVEKVVDVDSIIKIERVGIGAYIP